MKPNARVWRKSQRAAVKGQPRGRRDTHLTLVQTPGRDSTWLRRHNSWEVRGYWLKYAGTGRLLAAAKAEAEQVTP